MNSFTQGAMLLGALYAFSIGAAGYGIGYGVGKLTSPGAQDRLNLLKSFRLAKLNSDIDTAKVLEQQLDAARRAKEDTIRKTVYGVV